MMTDKMPADIKITDAHVHYFPQMPAVSVSGNQTCPNPDFLADFLTRTGTDSAVIQAIAHTQCVSLIPGALGMKTRCPNRFFVFGAPDATLYSHPNTTHTSDNFTDRRWSSATPAPSIGTLQRDFLRLTLEAGCDGIKLLEGKPQMRKTYPIPDFDSPDWEPFWSWIEEEQLPVMIHVNDPEIFWTPDASDWVKHQGWHYDETFVNNEAQYTQILNVLSRHPELKICFAHFFFMSAQLERLDGIMSRFPNVMVDLTPGIEMYENFSKDIVKTKQFFEKYHDRIVYGTDIGGRCILTNEGEPFNEKENLRRPEIVRRFLTSAADLLIEPDGNFIHDRAPFTMHCLDLPRNRLEEILNLNIRRFIGSEPKPVNPAKLSELRNYIERRPALSRALFNESALK